MRKLSSKKEFYVYVIMNTRRTGPYQYGRWKFEFKPLYVGKGKGNRALESLNDSSKSRKARAFANMRSKGYTPKLVYKKINLTEKQAFALEIELISKIGRRDQDTGPLFNHTNGGEGLSNPSPEVRERLRQANLGKRQSKATRKKRSDALKGRPRSAEVVERMRGRKMSPESIERTRQANLGIKRSTAARKRMSESRKAYHQTDAYKKTLASLTYKGKTKPVLEWSQRTGIKYLTLMHRIRNGWSATQVIETPVRIR